MRRSFPLPLFAALSLVPAVSARAEVNLARLGHGVVPTSQSVRLTLDPSRTDYPGSVHIELKAGAQADSFQLNARVMNSTTFPRTSLSEDEGEWRASIKQSGDRARCESATRPCP